MSKQRILMIVALCFVLIGTVAAGIPHEPKPDAIVSCHGDAGGGWLARWVTVPISVNRDACTSPQNQCSPCVRSLEEQGCKVVEATVTNIPPASDGALNTNNIGHPRASFLLSCAER